MKKNSIIYLVTILLPVLVATFCPLPGCTPKVVYVEQPISTKTIREKYFNSSSSQLIIANDGTYAWVEFKKWVRLKVGQEYEADWQQ